MTAIDVTSVSFSYPGRPALVDASFAVEPGTICGLLGPNGSGKSTLFRILTTLLRPQAGIARVLGADVVSEADVVRRRIGIVFQSPSLDRRLTAFENLMHQGHLFGLRGRPLRESIERQLRRVGLLDRAADMVGKLSGGQQRRVELAKCLLHRPSVLIMDEPSTGLDPAARAAFRELLRRLRDEDGLTTCLTTHFMEEADACDSLVLLDQGRVVARGRPAELKDTLQGECLVIRGARPAWLAEQISDRFSLRTSASDGAVRIEGVRSHEKIGPLMDAFSAEIDSLTIGKPTLEDVFIHYTGRRLEAAA